MVKLEGETKKRKVSKTKQDVENVQVKVKKSKSEKSKSVDEVVVNNGDSVVDTPPPFQKDFYDIHPNTSERSREDVKTFYKNHNIVLKGKGKKKFKPLFEFNELGFDEKFLNVCRKFSKPTPIQSCCWPITASGRDVIGIAETGSGKTLAFALPGLRHVVSRVEKEGKKTNGPYMLIVAPTRELAMQSQEVLELAGKGCDVKSVALYGGVPKYVQKKELSKGVEVVVATPGRLLDLISEGCCDLSDVSYLVLDEADRMLDQGFERDIRTIIGKTHVHRQTCLFSATWPESVRELAHEFLTRPMRVTIGSEDLAASTNIKQIVEVVDGDDRKKRLIALLNEYHSSRTNRVLVFVLYKKEAEFMENHLQRRGWNCVSIHGNKSQDLRSKAVLDFKSGDIPLLIATDVAARGLDIPEVDYVINYSFPLTIEDYVHRIGRTGRAGRAGTSHTFFQQSDKLRAGELVNVLKDAGQEVPESMNQFQLFTKKKQHKLYGDFGPKDYGVPMKESTRIVFDDDE